MLMVRRAGGADLPLLGRRVPQWRDDHMTRLGELITAAFVFENGDELLRRLAHPFRFQSLGRVMSADGHFSGITTGVAFRQLALTDVSACGGYCPLAPPVS
jgi:uncharacterized protein